MTRPIRVLLCAAALMFVAPAAHHHHRPRYGITHAMFERVANVQLCEEGSNGWHVDGPKYFGGLGWLAATWTEFRNPHFPRSAARATPLQQAWSMYRFIAHYRISWPDQPRGHCTGGY